MAEESPNQVEPSQESLNQKKMALAGSEYAPIIIELMKDCITQGPLINKDSQFETTINAITLDVQGDMLRNMVDLLEAIRAGSLHIDEKT